jgi:hypothetical protein
MGELMEPSPEQYVKLEEAGKLAEGDGPKSLRVRDGTAKVKLDLPRQGVVLEVLSWVQK